MLELPKIDVIVSRRLKWSIRLLGQILSGGNFLHRTVKCHKTPFAMAQKRFSVVSFVASLALVVMKTPRAAFFLAQAVSPRRQSPSAFVRELIELRIGWLRQQKKQRQTNSDTESKPLHRCPFQ
jgi:hypothetical protein